MIEDNVNLQNCYQIKIDFSQPQYDLFAEYTLGMHAQALVDYLWTQHNIDSESTAYNSITVYNDKDFATATLIISGFSDIKIA